MIWVCGGADGRHWGENEPRHSIIRQIHARVEGGQGKEESAAEEETCYEEEGGHAEGCREEKAGWGWAGVCVM